MSAGFDVVDALAGLSEDLRSEGEFVSRIHDAVEKLKQERDEARAEVGMLEDRLSESRAEVDRLTDERDELLVRVADQGAELRATREAYRDVYRRLCAPMWEEP
jgi:uncharacterized coiled-coil DUF342 family protein